MRSPILLYFSRRKSGQTKGRFNQHKQFCSNILILAFLANGQQPTANSQSLTANNKSYA